MLVLLCACSGRRVRHYESTELSSCYDTGSRSEGSFLPRLRPVRIPACRDDLRHNCTNTSPRGSRLRNDLYCVEWDVKLYYTIPYPTRVLRPSTTVRRCSSDVTWQGRKSSCVTTAPTPFAESSVPLSYVRLLPPSLFHGGPSSDVTWPRRRGSCVTTARTRCCFVIACTTTPL